MRYKLYAGVVALAVIGGSGFAVAQTGSGSGSSGSASAQGSLNLTPSQQQSVRQGLASQSPTPAPSGYQGAVGSKMPDSMAANKLPSSVQAQVPQTKEILFVKLPDRILLADPDSKTIVEIVPMSAESTGSGAGPGGGSMSPGGSSSGGSSSPGGMSPSSPSPGGSSTPR